MREREIAKNGGCQPCLDLYKLKKQPTPCSDCLPSLLEENIVPYFIWSLVQDQRIFAGMDGTSVALNHLCVWKAIDELNDKIPDRLKCFKKVLKVFSSIRKIEMEEEEEKNGRN